MQKRTRPPHLNPLPASGERRIRLLEQFHCLVTLHSGRLAPSGERPAARQRRWVRGRNRFRLHHPAQFSVAGAQATVDWQLRRDCWGARRL
jgi:hypothetical protein